MLVPKNELLEKTRLAYDRVGHRYDEETTAFNEECAYPYMLALLGETLGSLATKRVLDIGCGSGRLLALLEKNGATAEGVDISARFVEVALSKGLAARIASMTELPFCDGSFDATISYFALNYVPAEAQRKALSEQRRVLKREGVLVCASAYPGEERIVVEVPMFGETFTLYVEQKRELARMLYACNFVDVRFVAPPSPPCDIDAIVAKMKDPQAIDFVRGFASRPYALFTTARAA